MFRALIIGYGNAARGDDGLGCYAARILRDKLPADVQVLESHQLTPEMAEEVGRSELTIFIDADRSVRPGEVSLSRIEPAPPNPASLTHHVSPPSLLTLAETLFGSRPAAYLLSAGAACFGFEEGLSPAAGAALERVVECACDLVRAGDNGISYGYKYMRNSQ